uniref:G-protein coupled receptors family 1 profile domain-containing protein n=1 Tax=Anas platyrhynchos platyrhynchos TaxID=8840 RepID=A0A493TP42_ANAPP
MRSNVFPRKSGQAWEWLAREVLESPSLGKGRMKMGVQRIANHAQRQQMSNSSFPTEFLLLLFPDTRQLKLLYFGLFLGIYLAALLGNGLILTAIACDHRLHTHMYFFLLNLSLIDLGTITTTVPKATANSLWDIRAISYAGCATQLFMFAVF